VARELLNWEPAVGIDDGLQKTIKYFRDRMPAERVQATS
jgi:nucleoside-diphosphate-sugar epimerase